PPVAKCNERTTDERVRQVRQRRECSAAMPCITVSRRSTCARARRMRPRWRPRSFCQFGIDSRTMTSRIQLDRSGPLATLWLDRPDKRNALDAATMKDLASALDEVGGDRTVRVVVLRGRGPVFS